LDYALKNDPKYGGPGWASIGLPARNGSRILSNRILAAGQHQGSTSAIQTALRQPDAPRPYRTFGYPVVPALFVVTAVWLLFNSLQTSPVEAAMGLLLISLGLPVFFFYHGRPERKRM
jgi:basic amino acid/polyamine antiporter, APA family